MGEIVLQSLKLLCKRKFRPEERPIVSYKWFPYIYIPSEFLLKENLLSGGGGYSNTLPIRVCAAQRGRDFEAPDLARGIHFRGVF